MLDANAGILNTKGKIAWANDTGGAGIHLQLQEWQEYVQRWRLLLEGGERPGADRRARWRSLLAVPMLARWRDDREHEVKINSRDISDGGIFFHASSDIAIGTEVELTFTLPSDPGAAGNKRLRVQGPVLRAERETDKTGYALRVTSSELLGTEDAVAHTRQAVRRLAANDSLGASSRAHRAHVLFLACNGLFGLIVLTGLGILIARREGAPVNVAAAVREIVANVRSTQKHLPGPDVPQSRVEQKQEPSRTAGVVHAKEKKAASVGAQQEAAERNPVPAAQVRSLTIDSTTQPRPFPFNSQNIPTLDFQKGKTVSPPGYIGELSGPPAKPTVPVPVGSWASTPAKTGAVTAMSSSTTVGLLVVVGKDGKVEDVLRTSGSLEFAPAAIAAIRRWKFQPVSSDSQATHRQIYVTVNFTISTE